MKRFLLIAISSILMVTTAACAGEPMPQEKAEISVEAAEEEPAIEQNEEAPIAFDVLVGEGGEDVLMSIDRTEDDGYIAAGHTVVDGSTDCWVVKLSKEGDVEWEKTFGNSGEDRANAVRQTADGGYILACHSDSTDITNAHGSEDGWSMKLSANGEIEWETAVGGSGDDGLVDVVQTQDGGYTFVGYTTSSDGDVGKAHEGTCYWQLKTSASGEVEWSRIFEMHENEMASSVYQTTDGGYVISGTTSFFGVVLKAGTSLQEIQNAVPEEIIEAWVIKTSADGEIEWGVTMANSFYGYSKTIPTKDGGYMLAYTASSKGDEGKTLDSFNYWLVKLSSDGKVEWSKGYGGSDEDLLYGIAQLEDGTLIATGYTMSGDGEVSVNGGGKDCWTVGVSENGALLWEQSYGDAGVQSGACAVACKDGGYVIVGHDDGDAFVSKQVLTEE